MNDCLFCNIIKGNIPSKAIYEDELVKVFLDINPSTNGDALIIPKKHLVTIDDIDNDLLLHMMEIAKKIKKIYEEKLKIDGLTFVQNNGHGQEIKHFHIHLTPRYKDDMFEQTFNKTNIDDLDSIFNLITK